MAGGDNKNLIKIPVKGISLSVLYFRSTQESEMHKGNILALFDGNLVELMKSQKVSPLDYG